MCTRFYLHSDACNVKGAGKAQAVYVSGVVPINSQAVVVRVAHIALCSEVSSSVSHN